MATGVLVLSAAPPAAAHQEWFVNDPDSYPVDPVALLRPGVVLGIGIAIAVTLAWRIAGARLPVPELAFVPAARRLAGLVPWVPRFVAVHLGVSLLFLAAARTVLDPGIRVPEGVGGTVLLVPQALAGLLLIAGVLVRVAAVSIMLAGPVLVVLAGPETLAMSAVLLGSAAFLFLLPPRLREGGRVNPDPAVLRRAALALKVAGGVTLVSLAIVEKLANPGMASAMLAQEPVLNLLGPLGVSEDGFAVVAGTVELMLGLLLISGATPQVVALVAAVPFTATLMLFGTTELFGHLPVYGVLLTLLLLGSKEETSRAVSGLRPSADKLTRSGGGPRREINSARPG